MLKSDAVMSTGSPNVFAAVAAACSVLLVACSGGSNSSSAPSLPETATSEFYYPADAAFHEVVPGQLIAALEIKAPPGMRAWTILYGSTALDGKIVPASGLILAPAQRPKAAGYPVIAYAHGATGVADACAPSRHGLEGIPAQVVGLVRLGYVVTAADYQGLGTAGLHPFLVGIAEGRSVLDSIRAARNLRDAHVSDKAVIIGHSQGGHAALWAGELASAYAPQVAPLGVVSASPPIDLLAIEKASFSAASKGSWRWDVVVGALPVFGAWSQIYDLPLDFLSDEGRLVVRASLEECQPVFPSANPYITDPSDHADWRQRIVENTPGQIDARIPVLVISPELDEVIPYASQISGAAILCRARDTVELRTVLGNHVSSMWMPSAWEMVSGWVNDRFSGAPAHPNCP